MKRAFTILEIILVILIIGVIATLGLVQYSMMMERSRAQEARTILGVLRKAQVIYKLESGAYSNSIANLQIDVPTACTSTHYFCYACTKATGNCTAYRCINNTGKPPDYSTSYWLVMQPTGNLIGQYGGEPFQ